MYPAKNRNVAPVASHTATSRNGSRQIGNIFNFITDAAQWLDDNADTLNQIFNGIPLQGSSSDVYALNQRSKDFNEVLKVQQDKITQQNITNTILYIGGGILTAIIIDRLT